MDPLRALLSKTRSSFRTQSHQRKSPPTNGEPSGSTATILSSRWARTRIRTHRQTSPEHPLLLLRIKKRIRLLGETKHRKSLLKNVWVGPTMKPPRSQMIIQLRQRFPVQRANSRSGRTSLWRRQRVEREVQIEVLSRYMETLQFVRGRRLPHP